MKYFAFRIYNQEAKELENELKIGRLHQGWGNAPQMDLREKTARKDKGARKNFPIKDRVHKGDFIFVMNMPDKNHITLARATKDFSDGYIYDEKSLKKGGLGHIFPAKYLATIQKTDPDYIKNIFFCPRRFFEIKKHRDKLNQLIVKYYFYEN